METAPKISITQFAHWSRSGIISLIKTIAKNNEGIDFSLLLLESDDEFESFFGSFLNKMQLCYSQGKLLAILKYQKFISRNNIQIIHAHSLTPWLLACVLSRRQVKIFQLHCDYPYLFKSDFKSKLKQKILWMCANYSNSRLVSVSESSAERLHEITGQEVEYLPNGIPDIGQIRPLFERKPDIIKFYSVSRLDPEKNIEGAIELIAQLINRGNKVSYHIYGNGSQRSRLEKQIKHSGLAEHIQLMGFHNTPHDLPSQYDFYLSTSVQEGLSLSALHALRGQTPLVSTNVGQIGKVLKHGFNGFIIADELQSNIQVVEEIFCLPIQNLSQIQARGRQLYLSNFTQDIFLAKTYEIYLDAVRSITGGH